MYDPLVRARILATCTLYGTIHTYFTVPFVKYVVGTYNAATVGHHDVCVCQAQKYLSLDREVITSLSREREAVLSSLK